MAHNLLLSSLVFMYLASLCFMYLELQQHSASCLQSPLSTLLYSAGGRPLPCSWSARVPQSGCIPVGGTVPFQLLLHPESPGKFDAKLSVRLRQGKTLSLKLVGSVEEPSVSIDKVHGAYLYKGDGVNLVDLHPTAFVLSINGAHTLCPRLYIIMCLVQILMLIHVCSMPWSI